MSRILVVEDNADLAFGLRNNLEIEGHEVQLAGDGRDGLEQIRRGGLDLVILDLMLPEMDGFRVLRTLRQEGTTTPVLILTARGEEADKVRGLRLGANDYVTKPFGLLELLARVEVLLRPGQSSVTGVAPRERFGAIEIRPSERTVLRSGSLVELAPKEFDLLMALLRHRGGVVTRSQLLQEVWGYSAEVVSRTVDTHVADNNIGATFAV
jgi:two-component system alkaline phosphatase synthesis response regulator PhoP